MNKTNEVNMGLIRKKHNAEKHCIVGLLANKTDFASINLFIGYEDYLTGMSRNWEAVFISILDDL